MMLLLVGFGGSLGATARFSVSKWLPRKRTESFPFATWIVNLLGSFLLGFLARLFMSDQLSDWVWYTFGVGFCGAFTTFSTFSMELMEQVKSKKFFIAITYVSTSIILGIVAATIGFFL